METEMSSYKLIESINSSIRTCSADEIIFPTFNGVIGVGDEIVIWSAEGTFYSWSFNPDQPTLSHYDGSKQTKRSLDGQMEEVPLGLKEGVKYVCKVLETYELPYMQRRHFPNRPEMVSMLKVSMNHEGKEITYHFSNFALYGLGLRVALKKS